MLRRVTLTFVLALAGALLGAASAPAQSPLNLQSGQPIQILQNAPAEETGTLSPNQSSLSFAAIPYTGSGAHEEGGNNETEEITIENSGDATADIASVSIAGPGASSYSIQWGNCEHDYMQPGNTCTIGVRFEPVALGANEAQLVIDSDATNSPLTIPLEGEGLHGPQIGLSSTQALLGEVALGASAWHTFTLTNTGDYRLGVQQAFLVSGTPLMFPVLSDTCSGHAIAPGASCVVTVGFQPTTLGEKDASVVIITSSSLPVSVVGVDGIGVQPATDTASAPATQTPATQAPATQVAAPVSAPPAQVQFLQPVEQIERSSKPPVEHVGAPLPRPAKRHRRHKGQGGSQQRDQRVVAARHGDKHRMIAARRR